VLRQKIPGWLSDDTHLFDNPHRFRGSRQSTADKSIAQLIKGKPRFSPV